MANQQSSSSINNSSNRDVSLDVHNSVTNNKSNKQQVELATILKKNNKYTSTATTSTPSITTLASPTTNPTSTTIQRMAHYTAIADTAATGNYITTNCPLTDRNPTAQGVNVILPDGSSITSSHTAPLQLPSILPIGARTAHISLTLSRAHSSLLANFATMVA
jgi:hypothetical protein